MDLRKLKTLIDLVAESDIAELEVTEGESKVRIAKNSAVQGQQYVMQAPAVMPQQYMQAPAGMPQNCSRSCCSQKLLPKAPSWKVMS